MFEIQLLRPEAKPPTRAHASDAGLDLYADWATVLHVGERHLIGTGFQMSIPVGYVAEVWPRSGLAVKYGADTLAGVIDCDFRGEVMVLLINLGSDPIIINTGDRIGQLIIRKIELWNPVIVDELRPPTTARGLNGFGSTGK